MKVDENGNTILEVGDTILTKKKEVGTIININTGYDDNGWFYWYAIMSFLEDGNFKKIYLCDVDYILTPFIFR